MKSIWNGSIAFGLVNIPVKLYSAVEQHKIGFRLLHSKDNYPVKYKRWCDKCNQEVDWQGINKGLELSQGQYYVFEQDELEELKPEKTNTIEIQEFVDVRQIDPIFFNKHYYVAPPKTNESAYFLFKEVLQESARMAIGRFVMREREYVCAIESYREGLLLTTLNYGYEIRDIGNIEQLKSPPKLSKEQIELAKQLIDKLTKSTFEIDKFKDTFAEELKKKIKAKEKGKTVIVEKPIQRETTEKNLVQALRQSLGEGKGAKT